MTGVANAFRAESPFLLIGGQGALSQHKMGSLQDLPHVDMMAPITKFAATVPSTAQGGGHGVDGVPGVPRRGLRASLFLEIHRDILDAKVDASGRRICPSPAGTEHRPARPATPTTSRRLADILVASERPCVLLGSQVWTCRAADAAHEFARTLNIPAYMNGAGRGTFAPGRSPPLQPHPPHGLRPGRRDRHRRHAVRLPHGLRAPPPRGRHGRPRSTWTTGRSARTGTSRSASSATSGSVLQSVTAAASGHIDNGAASRKRVWLEELRAAEEKAYEKLLPEFLSDGRPGQPVPGGLPAQRVPHRGHHLHRRRGRRRDRQRPGRASTGDRPVDGSGAARHARCRGVPFAMAAKYVHPGTGGPCVLRQRHIIE